MNGDNPQQTPPLTPPAPEPAPGSGGGWGPPRDWFPPPPPPPPRGGGGLFRQHPIIMVALVLLVVVAIFSISAMFIGQKLGSGKRGLGKMSFGKKVGVVEVLGVIMDSRETVEAIDRFREDDTVSAVVIRVDSPGGVVGAAQEIYSEVEALAAEKPVVVSMGSVAASGGYYIACPAKLIYANPGTITGSIGVIMEFTNLEELMKWMKVRPEVIKSGAFKDTGSSYRPMRPDEHEYLQAFVNDVHQQFEEAVALGRKLSPEAVHQLADGRIFTGRQAKDLKLIDELGSLWDAIDKAAELGGIKGEPRVIWPPRRKGFWESFMQGVSPAGIFERGFPTTMRAMYILDH